MKRHTLGVAVALVCLLVPACRCYAQGPTLVAHVPFAFHVGSKTLPAGKYRVEPVSTGTTVLHVIRQVDGNAVAIVSSIPADAKGTIAAPALVFHRYGDASFLAEICTGADRPLKLARSVQEKEAARREERIEVGLLLLPSAKQ
jgi:hypothetical protein